MAVQGRSAKMQVVVIDDPAPSLTRGPRARGVPTPTAPLDGAGGGPGGPGPDGGDGSGPGRRGRARWWPVAAAAVVAVTVGVVVDAGSERRFADQVAEVPGLIAPVDGPVHELWRAPGSSVEGAVLPVTTGLVSVARSPSATTVSAHDWATGATLWSVDVGPGLRGAFEGGGTVCPTPVAGVASDALCVVSPDRPLYAGQGRRPITGFRTDGSSRVPSRRSSQVVVLSGADGSTLGTWDLGSQIFAVARVADDLVVARLLADGRTSVERRAGADGELLWERVSTARLDMTILPTLAAAVSADVVAVDGADRAVLDVADGSELMVVSSARPVAAAPAADGYATWSPDGGGLLVAADGTTTAVPGLPARLAADDGSTRGRVVLAAGSQVYAVDPGTGRVAWEAITMLDPVLAVSGSVVAASDEGVGVLDADDGTVLWTFDTEGVLVSPPVSDGGVVLTAEVDGLGGGVLEARGLRTGVRYWRVDLPRSTRWVDAVDGRLVATTQDEVVVLG